jgi:hypothetical protein
VSDRGPDENDRPAAAAVPPWVDAIAVAMAKLHSDIVRMSSDLASQMVGLSLTEEQHLGTQLDKLAEAQRESLSAQMNALEAHLRELLQGRSPGAGGGGSAELGPLLAAQTDAQEKLLVTNLNRLVDHQELLLAAQAERLEGAIAAQAGVAWPSGGETPDLSAQLGQLADRQERVLATELSRLIEHEQQMLNVQADRLERSLAGGGGTAAGESSLVQASDPDLVAQVTRLADGQEALAKALETLQDRLDRQPGSPNDATVETVKRLAESQVQLADRQIGLADRVDGLRASVDQLVALLRERT